MDRFKSIATLYYVQELVRYVHLNPVRAGICKSMVSSYLASVPCTVYLLARSEI